MEELTYEKTTGIKEILAELRRLNAGRPKKAYCRFRSTFYTLEYRPLLPGSEDDMARAALIAAQQFGGRVVRVAATRYSLQIDFLAPAELSLHRANVILRKATSQAYKARHRGIGPESSRGYLWKSQTISETMPPLLGRPVEYEEI